MKTEYQKKLEAFRDRVLEKAKAEYIKPQDEVDGLLEVQKEFGGQIIDTGGSCYVLLIFFDDYCISIGTDLFIGNKGVSTAGEWYEVDPDGSPDFYFELYEYYKKAMNELAELEEKEA